MVGSSNSNAKELGDFVSFTSLVEAMGEISDVAIMGGRALRVKVSPLVVGEELSPELAGESGDGVMGRDVCVELVNSGVCFMYANIGELVDDPEGVGLMLRAVDAPDAVEVRGGVLKVGAAAKLGEEAIKGDFFFFVPKLFLSQFVALPMTLLAGSSASTPPR